MARLSYFEKKKKLIWQWFKRMHLCAFVSLCARMSVAWANKAEGTMI